MSQEQGLLIIYKSNDDCKTFDPVKTEDVPEWVKDPDVIAHMVDGEAVINHEPTDNLTATYYIAKRVLLPVDHEAMAAAEKKRIRRAQKRIRLLH